MYSHKSVTSETSCIFTIFAHVLTNVSMMCQSHYKEMHEENKIPSGKMHYGHVTQSFTRPWKFMG